MHVLLSYNCVLTVVKYTDMLFYIMLLLLSLLTAVVFSKS